MRINVAGLLKSGVGSVSTYNIDISLELDPGESYPLQGAVKLQRTRNGLLVSAELLTQIHSICSRCLSPMLAPVSADMEEEFRYVGPALGGGSVPLPQGETDFTIGEDQVLDLGEAFRQYILLAMPLKPLCREDCAGLCAQCGHNLNEGPCLHSVVRVGQ